MTGLGRWLAGILNAHIERHNVPAAEQVTVELTIDTSRFDRALKDTLAGTETALIPVGAAARQIAAALATTAEARPCWACGDRVGFHVEHRPCWNAAPFTRNPPAPWTRQSDGSLL